jgi:hypothetical protein
MTSTSAMADLTATSWPLSAARSIPSTVSSRLRGGWGCGTERWGGDDADGSEEGEVVVDTWQGEQAVGGPSGVEEMENTCRACELTSMATHSQKFSI